MKIQDNSTLNEIQVQETKATEQAVGKRWGDREDDVENSKGGESRDSALQMDSAEYLSALWGMDCANSLSLDAIKPQEEVLINDTATSNVVGQHQQDKVFDINNKPCDDPTQSGNIAEKNSVDSPPKKLDETQIGKIAILEQGGAIKNHVEVHVSPTTQFQDIVAHKVTQSEIQKAVSKSRRLRRKRGKGSTQK
ncbi:hypothetical protein K7X08_003623 [Anisodus acutangulus]|uniref:Uncharacterized protein n=1 Tax=Anisodus acutangulus TaxID=402998 RepID=A0A9Q1MFP0_9SOLA|nr:hypothetical protein K7X08_003623 [Anisodus acutangulus]